MSASLRGPMPVRDLYLTIFYGGNSPSQAMPPLSAIRRAGSMCICSMLCPGRSATPDVQSPQPRKVLGASKALVPRAMYLVPDTRAWIWHVVQLSLRRVRINGCVSQKSVKVAMDHSYKPCRMASRHALADAFVLLTSTGVTSLQYQVEQRSNCVRHHPR